MIKKIDKKGQSMGLAIVSSVVVLIVGLMMINFIMPEITVFRNSLSCSSPADISDATKLLCLVGDSVVPYFILIVFSLVIGGITSRMKL